MSDTVHGNSTDAIQKLVVADMMSVIVDRNEILRMQFVLVRPVFSEWLLCSLQELLLVKWFEDNRYNSSTHVTVCTFI